MSRIFYLCHDIARPTGGIRVIYHHVHHLILSGFDASVVHFKPGLKIDWFPVKVPIVDASQSLTVTPEDWVVIPEDFIPGLELCSRLQCHKAVFCQNHFYIFDAMPMGKNWRDYGVEKILASSTEIKKFVHHVFQMEGVYIPLGIDQNLFCPNPEIRRLQIAYMPRKGSWNIRLVRGALWHRRADLRSIPWIPIENMSEKEVAATLQQSSIFLSTSFREGFGLPPLEAMACGCIVVGFTGGGGKEYAHEGNGFWVKDEDSLALADRLEKVLSDFCENPQNSAWEEIRQNAFEMARGYNVTRQKERLIDFWTQTLAEEQAGFRPEVSTAANEESQSIWFEKNLRVLAKRYPRLADKMKDTPLPAKMSAGQSIDSQPILSIIKDNGQEIFVYDRLNVRQKVQKDLRDLTFKAEDATLFLGFGLGYHIEEIAHRMEIDHQVFAIEPCMEVFRLAMSCRDLREIFAHDRIHLFVGEDPDMLYETLEYHLMRIVAGRLNEMVLRPLSAAFSQIYADSDDRIQKMLLCLKLSYRHCMGNKSVLNNILNNAISLSSAVDVNDLFGLLDGQPAIVVSGGPSLSSNIGLLKEAKGKACIIAVDTALQPLLQNEVEPDFVVSVDPIEQNYRKIEELPKHLDIPLVYYPDVYFKIPQHFKGAKFVTAGKNSLSNWFLKRAGCEESLGRAISAAHLAFLLARAMGADPVVLVGLDMSFPGEEHHVEGAAFTWAPNPDEEYVMVPDVFGGTVKTTPGFQAMIGLFETEVAKTRAGCIDATEGGALIRGTEIVSLDSALKRYVSQSRFDGKDELQKVRQSISSESGKELLEGLNWLSAEAKSISDLAREALPLIDRAIKMVDEGTYQDSKFSDLAIKIQELDRALGEKKLFDEIMIDFQAELLIYQYLQGYKMKRAKDRQSILKLSLESIERAFRDFKELSDEVISINDGIQGEGVC
ncbi:MAG: 6-hydroxymethylpterin diphosphokinase MptE-like protein [Pseudomonadota bacterium]